jgi:hypothetical protein
MANKTVTFLRETRVGDLYAEGAQASFDTDTANALIEGGFAVAGRQEILERPDDAEPGVQIDGQGLPPAADAPKVKTRP